MDLFDGSPRERILLALMGGAVVIGLLVFALRGAGGNSSPTPDAGGLDSALRELQTVQTALASRPGGEALEREAFSRARVIGAAQGLGVTLQRVEPAGDGGLSVLVSPAPSGDVLRFLDQIETQTAVRISELEISAAPDGLVETRVTFLPEPAR